MSGMTTERLAEIRANLPDPSADLSRRERDSHALLAHVDHLTAENARMRAGIADARMYCSRSTFCVTIPPTEGEAK